ncbi:MAG TPA: hypothetical protein VMV57_10880 [Terracidiphilus sp.]|nr:hypothetical protein [Terracidiphilus sp.]
MRKFAAFAVLALGMLAGPAFAQHKQPKHPPIPKHHLAPGKVVKHPAPKHAKARHASDTHARGAHAGNPNRKTAKDSQRTRNAKQIHKPKSHHKFLFF